MKIHNAILIFFVISLPSNIAVADNTPLFDNLILTIPITDSSNLPGEYQNATFEYTEQNGWQLLEFKNGELIEVINNEQLTPGINQAEIIQVDSFPIQVFIKITARMRTICEEFGKIRLKLKDSKFELFVYYDIPTSCSSVGGPVPFISKIIPLDIYGFKQGKYQYSVNGGFLGTFNLEQDNEL